MRLIEVMERPVQPDRWLPQDERLTDMEDLVRHLTDILGWVRFGLIPEDEPDADLLLSPLQLASCLREAAERIEDFT